MLTPTEEFYIRWQAETGRPTAARRAQSVLLTENGLAPAAIAAELRTTAAAVSGVLRQFQEKRLALWARPEISVAGILALGHVDMAHARQVADHALRLFDLSQPHHQLGPAERALLETAALLHNLGMEIDPDKHHTAGRDLLMAVRLAGHTPVQQRQLACAVRFHRKAARPRKEPVFVGLPARCQRPTLVIAALLRIADGLDYTQTQTTLVESLAILPARVLLTLAGPQAEQDGARAIEKSDLWRRLFDQDWAWRLPPGDLSTLAQANLGPHSRMAAVAARALADQAQRWQANVGAAQAGEPQAVKNVRAAARRARAALKLFRRYFKAEPLAEMRRQLKSAERALGHVRDWDVLLKLGAEAAGAEAWPILEAWRAARAAAQAEAQSWLAGPAAAEVQAGLARFAADPPSRRRAAAPAGTDAPVLLQDLLAELDRYSTALDESELATFHALRRRGIKPLRFGFEFLGPVLGESSEFVHKDLTRAQDRLGWLNDACVAGARIDEWLAGHPDDEAARRFQAINAEQLEVHRLKFSRSWPAVSPENLRVRIDGLVRRLQASRAEPLGRPSGQPSSVPETAGLGLDGRDPLADLLSPQRAGQ